MIRGYPMADKRTYQDLEPRTREPEAEGGKARRTEEQSLTHEPLFRRVFEMAPLGIVLVGPDYRYVDFNKAFVDFVGYSREEILAMNVMDLTHPEDKARHEQLAERAWKGETLTYSLEKRFLRKNGDIRWGNLTSTVFSTDEIAKCRLGIIEDITERKLAEEALLKSEKAAERLAQENAIMAEIGAIINSSLDIDDVYERFAKEARKVIPFDRISIYLVDREEHCMHIAYVSGGKLLGRAKGDRIPLEGSASKFIVETGEGLLITTGELEEYVRRFPILSSTFQTGLQSLIGIPLISQDEVVAILYFTSRQPDRYSEEEFRIAGRVGYQITSAIVNAQIFAGRRRAEEALKDSEARYRILFEQNIPGIAIYDVAAGQLLDANPSLCLMLGYSKAEILQVGLANLHPKESLHLLISQIEAQSREEQQISRSIPCLRKDGTVLYADIYGANTMVQGRRCVVGFFIDITERKRIEEELRSSERNFNALAENASTGILITLPNGQHVYANRQAAEITGYSVTELLEIGMSRLAHPDELPRLSEILKKRLSAEVVPGQYETRIVTKDGKALPIQVTGAKTDWHGQVADIVTFVDVSERKRTEEELRKHRDMLGELVKERTGELENKSRTLEELNVALKVLLRQVQEDREKLEQRLVSNVRKLVLPYVEKIKKGRVDERIHPYLDIVERNLHEIISPFLQSVQQLNLTPREIQVAALIKDGKTTKEIAETMGIGPSSVNTHRYNIRGKLNLNNKKVSLRTYLQSLK